MKKEIVVLLVVILIAPCVSAQSSSRKAGDNKKNHRHSRFVGKYEIGGTIVQFAFYEKSLVLVAPGAPVQKLKPIGPNKFRSAVFEDQSFTFEERDATIAGVTSEDARGTVVGKKISSEAQIVSVAMDSVLVLKKSTEHFLFRYSARDSASVDSIAVNMEKNYKRILNDFGLKKIPTVTVRIYPDLKTFHMGINFPDAPDEILATAFGKDDIRMVSPTNAGPASWMLIHFAPHEFTHCVHLNIDYSPNNPRWLWEGVAQYEAGWFFDPKELEVITKRQFPHFADLSNGMEYMLGYVIIEAIKDLWGFHTVVDLIKNRGDIQKTFKINEQEFEEKVYEQIYRKYAQR